MVDNLTRPELGFLLIVGLGYGLFVVIVAMRRGLRGREPGLFVLYLTIAVAWFLSISQAGLHHLWPAAPWAYLATYLLLGLGLVFWDLTRAFLQKPPLSIGGWLSALGVAIVLIVLDTGLIPVSPLSPALTEKIGGVAGLIEEKPALFLSLSGVVIYTGIAIVLALIEYAHRPSPLHRNRIKYWLLSTAGLVAGPGLVVLTRQAELEYLGTGLHWLGAAIGTYAVTQPQLPDIATGVRHTLSYLFATLIPVATAIGLSLGAVYLLSLSPFFRLRVSDELFFGAVMAGTIMFVLYQPLSSLTRRVVDRLLFGRGYRMQQVIRKYSQAISRIMDLEALAATAMEIIDGALGIQRGTLLVVEEAHETRWQLQVVEGLNVPGSQPPLILEIGTPLAKWLVERGDPLYQYTIDVNPQFETLNTAEREAWGRLGMEVFFPIKRSGTLIGLMALGLRRSGRPYAGPDLKLLATLADQTAVALENAFLFDRVERRAEQLALLNEIGRAISSALDLKPVVNLIAERIENIFEMTAGFIFLLDETEEALNLQRTFGQQAPTLDSFRIQLGQGRIGWVAAQGTPMLIPDLPGDSRYDPAIEGVLAPGAKSALSVPIISRGQTIGLILVVASVQTSFGSTELNLLNSIGSLASIAIENARQVAAREARLRRRVKELQIKIDELKRAREVELITSTDYFQQLRAKADQIRRERTLREEENDV